MFWYFNYVYLAYIIKWKSEYATHLSDRHIMSKSVIKWEGRKSASCTTVTDGSDSSLSAEPGCEREAPPRLPDLPPQGAPVLHANTEHRLGPCP